MNAIEKLSPKQAMILLGVGSGGLLAAVLVLQHGFGFWPCQMCLWQRWPHWLVLGLGVIGALPAFRWHRILLIAAAAALLTTSGLGFWHSGVEWGILPGLARCSGGLSLAGDASAVLDTLLSTPPPRCDEVVWSSLGLSMANWNGLISLAMAGLAVMVWARAS